MENGVIRFYFNFILLRFFLFWAAGEDLMTCLRSVDGINACLECHRRC